MKDILSLIKNSGLRYDSDGDAKNFWATKAGKAEIHSLSRNA